LGAGRILREAAERSAGLYAAGLRHRPLQRRPHADLSLGAEPAHLLAAGPAARPGVSDRARHRVSADTHDITRDEHRLLRCEHPEAPASGRAICGTNTELREINETP